MHIYGIISLTKGYNRMEFHCMQKLISIIWVYLSIALQLKSKRNDSLRYCIFMNEKSWHVEISKKFEQIMWLPCRWDYFFERRCYISLPNEYNLFDVIPKYGQWPCNKGTIPYVYLIGLSITRLFVFLRKKKYSSFICNLPENFSHPDRFHTIIGWMVWWCRMWNQTVAIWSWPWPIAAMHLHANQLLVFSNWIFV